MLWRYVTVSMAAMWMNSDSYIASGRSWDMLSQQHNNNNRNTAKSVWLFTRDDTKKCISS